MKILILGASGFCGSYIKKYFTDRGYTVYGTYRHFRTAYREDLYMLPFSVEETEKITGILQEIKPQTVISCLRGDFEQQLKVHEILADYIKEKESRRLFYFSSANVFDKDTGRPHYEEDQINAQSEYGQFKGACEELLKTRLRNQVMILRLPMVLDRECPRIRELEEKNRSGGTVPLYKNVFVNLTTPEQICQCIQDILREDIHGIFHIGTTDMCECASLYIRLAKILSLENLEFEMVEEGPLPEYLAVISRRESFPKERKMSVEQVIDYLTNPG